jgi:rubrerythrin
MATLVPTKNTGAVGKVNLVVYREPGQQVTDAMLEQQLVETGLNASFLADFLSGVLTHERCGRQLYRSCVARSADPELRSKYEEFGAQTERHVEILEQLITDAGGSPMYVGPTARAVLGSDTNLLESTFVLSGSVDLVTAELAMLDAVFLAESMDHANWTLLAQLAAQLDDTPWAEPLRAAVDEVLEQEAEHLTWATRTKAQLVTFLASSDGTATLSDSDAELVDHIQAWSIA